MISVVQGEADDDNVGELGNVFEAVIQSKLDPLTISEWLQVAIWQLLTIHYLKLLLQSLKYLSRFGKLQILLRHREVVFQHHLHPK